MLYLICVVVSIDKQRLPFRREGGLINSKSMILRGDECLPIELIDNWLVMSSGKKSKKSKSCTCRILKIFTLTLIITGEVHRAKDILNATSQRAFTAF